MARIANSCFDHNVSAIKNCFALIDKDHSGLIDEWEFHECFGTLVTQAEEVEIFGKFNIQKDNKIH